MSKEISVAPSVTQYSGVFKLKDVLSLIRSFLSQEGYDVIELKHKIKNKSEGTEGEIDLDCDYKMNHYVKFKIGVSLKISDMVDVEVNKVKMQQGQLNIKLSGAVELDYDSRFDKNKFLVFLQEIYHKFIMKQTIDNVYWDTVHTTMFRLQRAIRDQLQFEAR